MVNTWDRPDGPQPTNLLRLCQQVARRFERRMQRQNVLVQFDADPALKHDLPRASVQRVLDRFFEDALTAMPDGGVLDVAVVRTRQHLEIEVADSGPWGGCDEERVPRLVVWPSAESDQGSPQDDWRIETLRCPQGGIARTLVIPLVASTQRFRNAA